MKTGCTPASRCEQARRYRTFRTILASLLLVSFCMAQENGSQGRITKRFALSRADRNKVIYVSDFELDPNNFRQDKGGITGKGYIVPAPPKSFLRRKHQDPATASNNLLRLMSESLVADLQRAGFTAHRLSSAEPKPSNGLLVTGMFTELSEGNQMRRALLGFGSGKAKMELYVAVADISGTRESRYDASMEKSSSKAPGAAMALNPYMGAGGFVAKFGMTKNAPEKMVKKTASNIAALLSKQLNADSTSAAEQASIH